MKTAKEFNEAFDNNEDLEQYIDWSKAKRPNISKNGSIRIFQNG